MAVNYYTNTFPHYPVFRENPECGFSHRVCMIMDELRVEYETVDTLDEVHNHNLRNVLKRFSDWPTIPQVYFCLLYTSPSPRDVEESRMPSSA